MMKCEIKFSSPEAQAAADAALRRIGTSLVRVVAALQDSELHTIVTVTETEMAEIFKKAAEAVFTLPRETR